MTNRAICYRIVLLQLERYNMTNKTFYITYWASKHKKHITRKGKHDDKSRYGTSKQGVPYYVYYDLDSHGYRTATTTWKVRH